MKYAIVSSCQTRLPFAKESPQNKNQDYPFLWFETDNDGLASHQLFDGHYIFSDCAFVLGLWPKIE
jgi:hypothetical protein